MIDRIKFWFRKWTRSRVLKRLYRQPWSYNEPDVSRRVEAFNAAVRDGREVLMWSTDHDGKIDGWRSTVHGRAQVAPLMGGKSVGLVAIGNGNAGKANIEMMELA